MDYYKAHCVKCGEETYANNLAFDFEKLIHKSINKQMNRKLAKKDDWKDLLKYNFKIYLTLNDLQNDYGLNDITKMPMLFEFKVNDLKKHIQKISGYDFMDIMKEDVTKSIIYEKLINIFFGEKDNQDIVDLATQIQEFFNFVANEKDDEVIAFFNLRIILSKDDLNQEFANMLEVKYEDDEMDFVIQTVCPYCGHPFYTEIGKYQEIIIGLAGTARVGKTAYLVALVYSILKRNSQFISILPTDDPRYRKFRDTILIDYSQCQKIKKTEYETSIDDISVFSLAIFVAERGYIFTFVDMPGEAFDDSGFNEKGGKFIKTNLNIFTKAKMFWVCIDPRQIGIDKGIASPDIVNTNLDNAMSNLKKTMAIINRNKDIDAAILITKRDTIAEEKIDVPIPECDVFEEYIVNNELNFDLEENEHQGMKVFMENSQRLLEKNNSLLRAINSTFNRYSSFVVAAYGRDIDAIFEEKGLKPSMIEAPFLWTLSVLELLDAKKTVWEEERYGLFDKKIRYVPRNVYVPLDELFIQKENKDAIDVRE